jgi:hypothetical protein
MKVVEREYCVSALGSGFADRPDKENDVVLFATGRLRLGKDFVQDGLGIAEARRR